MINNNNYLSWINLDRSSSDNKNNGKMDYNLLSNKPIKRLIGTAETPIKLWKLIGGLYLLDGFVQYSIDEIAEKESLFVSVIAEIRGEAYIVSVFIPFWEAQYDYVMNSSSDENYVEYQTVGFLMEGDIIVPTKLSELTNDSNFITSIPSEYITETELNNKGYLTEHQDLSHLALKSEIPTIDVDKTYVDEQISSLPQFSFDENGKLVVTIDGIVKTFTPDE